MVKSLALSSRGHGFKPGPQCLDHKRIFRRSLNIITETTELMSPGDALGRELAALLRGTEYMWGNPECPEVDPVTFNLLFKSPGIIKRKAERSKQRQQPRPGEHPSSHQLQQHHLHHNQQQHQRYNHHHHQQYHQQ